MTKASIMTFNIAHGRGLSPYQGLHTSRGIRKNLDRIARVISRQKPDIVALQEVDECSHWNKRINLLEHLQEATGYPHAHHGVHNRRSGKKPLSYGNAFLSRYPISDSMTVAFGDKRMGEKGFSQISAQLPDTNIDVINLHLDFRSKKARIQQVERIIENLHADSHRDESRCPPIVCGDFNTGSKAFSDAVRQFVVRAAQHVDYDYFPKKGLTFPSHLPSRGLDFILLPRLVSAKSVNVIKSYASDHFPVLMTFEIDKAQAKEAEQAKSA